MSSKFEDTLIRGGLLKKKIRQSLFEGLDAQSLRNLRACSRSLERLMDQDPTKLFCELYIDAPLRPHQTLDQLRRVSMFCCKLTIKVGYVTPKQVSKFGFLNSQQSRANTVPSSREAKPPLFKKLEYRTGALKNSRPPMKYPTTPIVQVRAPMEETVSPTPVMTKQQWVAIVSAFQQLTDLRIAVRGNPEWPGRTTVEDLLIALRIALETVQPANLRKVSFTPIHAMGLIHVRWSGLSAFGQSSVYSHQLWQRLSMLDLQIHNPLLELRLSPSQRAMFKKLLHGYLQSFSQTLKDLRFVWLDGQGPNPLTLDLDTDLLQDGHPERQQTPIHWPHLRQLWVGGVASPQSVIHYAQQRCPLLSSFKTLRSTMRDSMLVASEVGDSGAWIDVIMGPVKLGPFEDGDAHNRSSFYSQESMIRNIDGRKFEGNSRASKMKPVLQEVGSMLSRKSERSDESEKQRLHNIDILPSTMYRER